MDTIAALLIIDVHKELFQKTSPIHEAEKLLVNIRLLVGKVHAAKVSALCVQHSTDKVLVQGTGGWQLYREG